MLSCHLLGCEKTLRVCAYRDLMFWFILRRAYHGVASLCDKRPQTWYSPGREDTMPEITLNSEEQRLNFVSRELEWCFLCCL